jgi:adenosylhomocysteine nucleosidase
VVGPALRAAVILSAGAEWRAARDFYQQAQVEQAPLGEWFLRDLCGSPVLFFHGGWGKISAAATAQYVLDRWSPPILVNLGTCGGFADRKNGLVERGEILLVERTLVYDIIEQMGDPEAAIRHYTTDLDLSWLRQPYPQLVRRSLLVSADRDIYLPDIPALIERYDAVAADWESGAIAWVSSRNGVRCLILRGVSDLVGQAGGEAYGAIEVFREGTRRVMEPMLSALPRWLDCCQ